MTAKRFEKDVFMMICNRGFEKKGDEERQLLKNFYKLRGILLKNT